MLILVAGLPFTAKAQDLDDLTDKMAHEIFQNLKDAPAPTKSGQLGLVDGLSLRPLQALYGKIEAARKAKALKKLSKFERHAFLVKNAVPVVIAPDGNYYIIDHHHEDVAARMDGIDDIVIVVKHVYRGTMEEFWKAVLADHLCYPYDKDGNGPLKWDQLHDAMPKNILGLRDDVYRSLAGLARELGAYIKGAKDYFIEFDWADFFSQHIKVGQGKKAFKKALIEAVELAHTPEASKLPGYVPEKKCGAVGKI